MASMVTQIQPFLAGGMFLALALGQPRALAPHLNLTLIAPLVWPCHL